MKNIAKVRLDNGLVVGRSVLSLQERRLVVAALGQVGVKIKKTVCERTVVCGGVVQVVEEGKYDLSENTLISPDNVYYVSAEYFAEVCGVTLESAKDILKEAADKLYERSVTFMDGDVRIKSRWISAVAEYDAEEHWVGIQWAPKIIPYISALTRDFTQFPVVFHNRLKRVASMQLYSYFVMCKSRDRYRKVTKVTLSMEELLGIFQIEGKYKVFADFRRDVLDKVLAEINKNTDIFASYDENGKGNYVKCGKKVVGIVFGVKRNGEENEN